MILDLTINDALAVADGMRADDRAEVMAVTPVTDLRVWARRVVAAPGVSMAVRVDGEAAAMGGGLVIGHLAAVWFVATDRIEEQRVRIACHRMAIACHRRLFAAGVRRCQAMAAQANRHVGRWLQRMGYGLEGTHPGYGRGGETFVTWGRILTAEVLHG